jgi:predicted amidophosphoribosyltransferase
MNRELLSLEEPPLGTCCERCGLELRVLGFCPECFEKSMRLREAAIRADHEEARKRARTWQVNRAVQA